ncbi:hypothetical protein ACHQM5_010271 [Ranunculus cassubicifolius]
MFNFSLWDQKESGSEKAFPSPPPPPCMEVPFSKVSSNIKYTVEPITFEEGSTLLKGRVSTQEVFALSNSDLVPGKYEGGLKLWEGSLDLVKALRSEISDGQLSLIGKRVLELGCGHGLPGIFMCLEGASVVHFQDFNAEVLRCLTIPNLRANFGWEPMGSLAMIDKEKDIPAEVRFFSGDWSEVHQILPHVCGSEDHKSSDSSSEQDPCVGYDIILMAETVYSISSLQSLYELSKKCLSRPCGVIYLAAKKHYFGVGGGTRQFLSIVDKDGVMASSLVAEVTDGSSNVREVWKFSFK